MGMRIKAWSGGSSLVAVLAVAVTTGAQVVGPPPCRFEVVQNPVWQPPMVPPCGLGGNCSGTWGECPGGETCITHSTGGYPFSNCGTAGSTTVTCDAFQGGTCVAGQCVKDDSTIQVGTFTAEVTDYNPVSCD